MSEQNTPDRVLELQQMLKNGSDNNQSLTSVLGEVLEEKGADALYRPKIGYAYEVARKADMKVNQLHKLFDEVMALERKARRNSDEWQQRLPMLQVLIAYSRGRDLMKKEGYEFYSALFDFKLYQGHEDVEKMAEFFRAVVAYAKFQDKSQDEQ